jgi:hypothetical protein
VTDKVELRILEVHATRNFSTNINDFSDIAGSLKN